MKIKIINLYGIKDGCEAYYRKLGDCFDFVSSIEYASDLTANEVNKVLEYRDWFLKQYNAEKMIVVI